MNKSLLFLFAASCLSFCYGCNQEPTNCLVQFDSNGGTHIDSISIKKGSTINEPAKPTRENYTFDYWSNKEDLSTKFDFTTPINSDLKLYAKWNENEKYSLSFTCEDKNVSLNNNYDYIENDIIPGSIKTYAIQPNPGYQDVKLTVKCDDKVITEGYTYENNIFTITVNGNISIVATASESPILHNYTIVVDDNYDGGGTKTYILPQYTVITGDEYIPTRKGKNPYTGQEWEFECWRDEDRNEVSFPLTVDGDIFLYAKWVGEEEFDSNVKTNDCIVQYVTGVHQEYKIIENEDLLPKETEFEYHIETGGNGVVVDHATDLGTYYISLTIGCEGYRSKSFDTKTLIIKENTTPPTDDYRINPRALLATYDGNPKGLKKEDVVTKVGVPEPTSITFKYDGEDEQKTNVGAYTVSATIFRYGYEPFELTEVFYITPASLPDDCIVDKIVHYDGKTEYKIDEATNYPDGSTIKYGIDKTSVNTEYEDLEMTSEKGIHMYYCKIYNPNYYTKLYSAKLGLVYQIKFNAGSYGKYPESDNFVWKDTFVYLDDKESFEANILIMSYGVGSPVYFHYNFTYDSTKGLIDPPNTGSITYDDLRVNIFHSYVKLNWNYEEINSDIVVGTEIVKNG